MLTVHVDFLRAFTSRLHGLEGDVRPKVGVHLPFLGSARHGLVSESEFKLWLTLLRVDEEHLPVAFAVFDEDHSATVEFAEFGEMISSIELAERRKVTCVPAPSASASRLAGVRGSPPVVPRPPWPGRSDDGASAGRIPLASLNVGRFLFGDSYSRKLSCSEFCSFLEAFRREILRYEFDCYRYVEATAAPSASSGDAATAGFKEDISALSFAQSLLNASEPALLGEAAQRARRCRSMQVRAVVLRPASPALRKLIPAQRLEFADFYAAHRAFSSFPVDVAKALTLGRRLKGRVVFADFKKVGAPAPHDTSHLCTHPPSSPNS